MKRLVWAAAAVCLLASLPASADDWKDHLSPRMRQEFKNMLDPGWSPKREVELTQAERNAMEKAVPHLEKKLFEETRPHVIAPAPVMPKL